jgi:hypothetical protein
MIRVIIQGPACWRVNSHRFQTFTIYIIEGENQSTRMQYLGFRVEFPPLLIVYILYFPTFVVPPPLLDWLVTSIVGGKKARGKEKREQGKQRSIRK